MSQRKKQYKGQGVLLTNLKHENSIENIQYVFFNDFISYSPSGQIGTVSQKTPPSEQRKVPGGDFKNRYFRKSKIAKKTVKDLCVKVQVLTEKLTSFESAQAKRGKSERSACDQQCN